MAESAKRSYKATMHNLHDDDGDDDYSYCHSSSNYSTSKSNRVSRKPCNTSYHSYSSTRKGK